MSAQRWTGTAWAPFTPQRWTGTAWVPVASAKRWTGVAWVEMLAPAPNPRLFANLADTFNDGVVSEALWPDAYGGVTETGGRARVPTASDYAALQSAPAWQLEGSGLFVEVPKVPALVAPATATTASFQVLSGVEGTSAGFTYDAAAGTLRLVSNVSYWDDNAVALPYNATAHRWWRITETAGTLTWATSPDGLTWTTRRTLPTPAWVIGATTLQLDTPAYSNDPASTAYVEYDNLNSAP
ncbi:hypothetical protein [Streptomyces sp. SID5910]|uniref:hypothetical protein n=1 Tax=Streptomyces sp. SID5910 TaxID=2690312 RepID=UPI00136AD341|nr:hypothetical protein [Streptomyces sp. SID5910]MYR46586.1 hypothetical protein [Streptomyces sp. SID5910]